MTMDLFRRNRKSVKYRLFLLSLDKENFSKALNERFSRITPFYILIYTDKHIKGASEITDENACEELSKADSEWLRGCNYVLLSETVFKDMNMLKEAQKKFYVDLAEQIGLVLEEEYGDGRNEK